MVLLPVLIIPYLLNCFQASAVIGQLAERELVVPIVVGIVGLLPVKNHNLSVMYHITDQLSVSE